MSEKLEILMPIHNEEKIIKHLIPEIDKCIDKRIEYSFICCEDGSEDNSLSTLKELSKKYPIKIITSKIKKGYSIAMQDGIKAATADYLLFMDSDGQSNPDEIYNFWVNRDKADIINGNRANRDDFMYRKIYSNIAFIIYKILFNLPIKDPSYAFVLTKRKVYEELSNFKPEMPDGFFWEFNARASKKKFNFFNLNIIHKKRLYGVTRIYSLKNLPLVSFNNFIGMIKIKIFS